MELISPVYSYHILLGMQVFTRNQQVAWVIEALMSISYIKAKVGPLTIFYGPERASIHRYRTYSYTSHHYQELPIQLWQVQ